MQSGQWSRTIERGSIISDLLGKYLTDVTSKKRQPEAEKRRLNRLLKDSVANHHLEIFDSTAAAQFRDRQLADGLRTTEYDLILLRHAWNIANKEWGCTLGPNPILTFVIYQPIQKKFPTGNVRIKLAPV